MQMTGIDHIYLTVSDFAGSERFYDALMEPLRFRKGTNEIAGAPHCHYDNQDFQITIRRARTAKSRHDPYAPGLHRLCLRVADRESVEGIRTSFGISVDGPRALPEYAPDYYAVFFDDPDGLRLEIVNHFERRRAVRERWNELEGFVVPLDRLLHKDR
jgi:glyoxylase I family protein